MRAIHTLILRLLIDSDHPNALRGALQTAEEPAPALPFHDEAALLALLQRLVAEQLAAEHSAAAALPAEEKRKRQL